VSNLAKNWLGQILGDFFTLPGGVAQWHHIRLRNRRSKFESRKAVVQN
jgi:hypothetical protein